ncbi:MAG TPA: SAM-dependent chlorinase/fluorinase, partial [Thermoanaerobaculia bacterium]|nr:SAM-dependent chlorinase/fluorinase [Thermoanaerobaculia bacterium]
GAVKGTLLRLAPATMLVDVSHQVPAGDIAYGAFLLGAYSSAFPPETIHLAVVDPGVGSARAILAARSGSQLYVAPDNGLLTPVLEGAEVYAIDGDDLFLDAPGSTFHGRDRFAPVAAALARGEKPAALGRVLRTPVILEGEKPTRTDEILKGRVIHVDRFGNVVTDLPAAWLPEEAATVEIGFHSTSRRISHYSELGFGQAGWLIGSLGTLELSLDGASLAERWQVTRDDEVRVALR